MSDNLAESLLVAALALLLMQDEAEGPAAATRATAGGRDRGGAPAGPAVRVTYRPNLRSAYRPAPDPILWSRGR